MAVLHHNNIDLDVNSNCYNDSTSKDGYWGRTGDFGDLEYDTESWETGGKVDVGRVASLLENSLRSAKKAHLSCGEVLLPPHLLTRVARDILHMADTEPCGLRGCLILLHFESGSPLPPPLYFAPSHPSSTSSSPSSSGHNSQNNSPPGTPTATSPPMTMLFNYSAPGSRGTNASSVQTTPAPATPPGGNHQHRREIGKIRFDNVTVTTFELHLTLKEDLAPWYSRLPQILRNLTKGGTIVVSPAYTIAKKKLYRSH